MISLDTIKGTWMENRVKAIISCNAAGIQEASTRPYSEVPKYLRIPPSRGGLSRPHFVFGR